MYQNIIEYPMASATTYSASPESWKPQIQHIIDIPEQIEPVLPDQCCIYKVPSHLLKLNEEAYTPQFISIGPLHSHNSDLKQQEKQKLRYFHAFWKRLSNQQALAFMQYKAFLEENRENIGNCYSKPELCEEDQFVGMILLDSVFIMELFLRKSNKSEQKNDCMFTTSWIFKITQRDLLLLENQLPMFVLEELHTKVLLLGDNDDSKENHLTFMDLAFNYFEDYYPHNSTQKMEMVKNFKSCKHFTDLIRYTYLPREIQVNEVNPSEHFTPSPAEYYIPSTATKLNKAGVTFEKVKGRSYLDMNFNKTPILNWFLCFGCFPRFKIFQCRLQIPQFIVTQTTECVVRNLIALEQCHYSDQPFICNYVSLIDSLIYTKQDVELLVDKEVIVHELASHIELAILVNDLCKYVVVNCNYYGKITKELNEHSNSFWKCSMGIIKCVCLRSSTYVGLAIFLLTIANSYFKILPFPFSMI